jgi:ribonuclease HII
VDPQTIRSRSAGDLAARTVIRKSSGCAPWSPALYRSGLGPVAGVDEVGRGACAGPLVVAACVLGPNRLESLAALDDSKKLTEKERERLFPLIRRYALAYPRGVHPVRRRSIAAGCTWRTSRDARAVAGLSLRPGYVLSDGFRVPGLPLPSLPVVGGDAAAACIAAASVLAKVSRDRLMVKMEAEHPGYGFAEHKGYSTPAHGAALAGSAVQPASVLVHQRPPRGHGDRHQGGDGARGRLCTGAARRSRVREDGHRPKRRTAEAMSAEDLEKYETEMELSLYREYKDIVGQFSYVVETERRFYLANSVELVPRNADGEVYFELRLADAWVWDMYRPARFVKQVRVITFKDVNIEEVEKPELRLPE